MPIPDPENLASRTNLERQRKRELTDLCEALYDIHDCMPLRNQPECFGWLRLEGEAMKISLWIRRFFLLLLGLTIAHLGVTLFLLADLGSDPFNVLIQGLFRFFPWPGFMTHGYVHMGVSFGIILVLLAVDRSYIRIGTLLCMVLGGPIIDVFTGLLGGLVNGQSVMALRLGALVAGCVILAFGMTVVINSKAGTGPNDLVAVVISDKTRWKFGAVRIGVDVCFALAGFLLGGTVGVGTVICAFLVGPAAQVFMPVSGKLCSSVTGEASFPGGL